MAGWSPLHCLASGPLTGLVGRVPAFPGSCPRCLRLGHGGAPATGAKTLSQTWSQLLENRLREVELRT